MQVTLGKALLTSHQLKSHRVWVWLGMAYVRPGHMWCMQQAPSPAQAAPAAA